MGLGEIRTQTQCLAVASDGVGPVALPREGVTQVVVGVGIVGLELQRLPVATNRLVELSQMTEAGAEVVDRERMIGLDFYARRMNSAASANRP